jgi:hypothetical protein
LCILRGALDVNRGALAPTLDSRHREEMLTQAHSVPGYITSVAPVVKLAKMIILAFVMIAGILTFDLLILWIASGKLIERIPF